MPEREELAGRLDTVLDAIYAAYSEGWADAIGADVARRELAGEALYLCRLITELLPGEPEALGLLALDASRGSPAQSPAKRGRRLRAIGPAGHHALESLDHRRSGVTVAEGERIRLGRGDFNSKGRCNRLTCTVGLTGTPNWPDVLALYDALFALSGSPVVAINRCLAVAEVHGARTRSSRPGRVDPRTNGSPSTNRTGLLAQSF